MRPSNLVPWTVATVLALGFVLAPAVKATSDYERPGELGILAGAGVGDENLVGSDNQTHINPMVGGRFGWHFGDKVAGFLEATWLQYAGDPALFGDLDEYTFRMGPEFYANPASKWQFFFNVALGAVRLKTDASGTDDRSLVSAGIGTRRGWKPGALRLELRGDRTVTGAGGLSGHNASAIKAIAGWTWGVGARPTDTDGDGVFDKKDKCPDTPHGAIVDAQGCPTDSDRDGVCDGIDQCPGTASGLHVDAKGCPPPPPPPPAVSFIPERKKELVLERVYFEIDSARLKPESADTLDKVAASLKQFPDVKILVAGHTDNTGSAAHNMKLSDARASAVMNYLISKGVNPARLSEKGFGFNEPIADNKTKEGRTQNRRVGLRRVD